MKNPFAMAAALHFVGDRHAISTPGKTNFK